MLLVNRYENRWKKQWKKEAAILRSCDPHHPHPSCWQLVHVSTSFGGCLEHPSIRSWCSQPKKTGLVGGLEHQFYFPINIGFLIIPIDELIFFRGVAQPPTSGVGDFEASWLMMTAMGRWCHQSCWTQWVRKPAIGILRERNMDVWTSAVRWIMPILSILSRTLWVSARPVSLTADLAHGTFGTWKSNVSYWGWSHF